LGHDLYETPWQAILEHWLPGIYIQNITTISKKFHYFSTINFKKNLGIDVEF
jgi:hypothetical protein